MQRGLGRLDGSLSTVVLAAAKAVGTATCFCLRSFPTPGVARRVGLAAALRCWADGRLADTNEDSVGRQTRVRWSLQIAPDIRHLYRAESFHVHGGDGRILGTQHGRGAAGLPGNSRRTGVQFDTWSAGI